MPKARFIVTAGHCSNSARSLSEYTRIRSVASFMGERFWPLAGEDFLDFATAKPPEINPVARS